MTAEILRTILLIFLFAMLALGLDFLRRRRMPFNEFALWGLFALLVPALGPFLVIVIQPGKPARRKARRNQRRRTNV